MKFVEYIQNGTSANKHTGWDIPLNYCPSSGANEITMRVRLKVLYSITDGELLIGSKDQSGDYFRLFGHTVNKLTFDCPEDSQVRLYINFTEGTNQTIECSWNRTTHTATISNITRGLTDSTSGNFADNFTSNWHLWGEYLTVSESVQIFEIVISEDGTVKRHYLPALDNNDTPCLYEEVGNTYHYNSDATKILTTGSVLSSIFAVAASASLSPNGESTTIAVTCQNAWTVTGNTFLTLSSASGSGNDTITVTAPAYTGTTNRTDTLVFTDSVTGDTATVAITQKKLTVGQPLYLGGDEITEIFLGSHQIQEAYLGEHLVFSTGPFAGLKVDKRSLTFNADSLSATVRVRSSESWTVTTPAWISASPSTGTTGYTDVTLTATAQQAATSGSVVFASANYSATVAVEYSIGTPVLQIYHRNDVDTNFAPYTAYTANSNYLKYEICANWTSNRLSSEQYLYQIGPSVPFFSCERFRTNNQPYCNIGNGSVSYGPANGGGTDHIWIVEVNGNTVTTYIDGTVTETNTISGTWPTGNLQFAGSNSNNAEIDFYYLKFYGQNNTLLADFRPHSSNAIVDLVSQTVYPKTGGAGTLTYRLDT